MSTRSLIFMKDGEKYRGIYCHWDGYPDHNGRILLKHYTDEGKIRQLLELGSISVLGAEIGEKHDFDAAVETIDNNAVKSQCTAYHRDRGDVLDQIECDSMDIDKIPDSFNWLYVWQDGEWYCTDGSGALLQLSEIVEE